MRLKDDFFHIWTVTQSTWLLKSKLADKGFVPLSASYILMGHMIP